MRKLVEFTVRMRLPLLLLCLALTAVFLSQAKNAKLYDDPNEWLPPDNPIGKLNKYLQEKFGGGNLVTIQISVKNGDIFNVETLAKVKRMTREVLLTWGVVPYNVLSIAALQVQFLGVLSRYATSCFFVSMDVACYFLPSSVSPAILIQPLAWL